jgi:hypothetical protein
LHYKVGILKTITKEILRLVRPTLIPWGQSVGRTIVTSMELHDIIKKIQEVDGAVAFARKQTNGEMREA